MWILVIFAFTTSGAAASTVTTLAFDSEQLCNAAAKVLLAETEPVSSGRYNVVAKCVQTSEPKKR